MDWYWYIVIFIFIFLLFIIISDVKLHFVFNKEFKNDYLSIDIYLFYQLIKIRKKIPLIVFESLNEGIKYQSETNATAMDKEKKDRITGTKLKGWNRDYKEFLKKITDFYQVLKIFLQKVHIDKLEWKTVIGTDDAMVTGILAGFVWQIKGIALGIISNLLSLDTRPQLVVTPDFNNEINHTRIECILRFRVGNVILTGMHILFKLAQGGRKKWHKKNILSKA